MPWLCSPVRIVSVSCRIRGIVSGYRRDRAVDISAGRPVIRSRRCIGIGCKRDSAIRRNPEIGSALTPVFPRFEFVSCLAYRTFDIHRIYSLFFPSNISLDWDQREAEADVVAKAAGGMGAPSRGTADPGVEVPAAAADHAFRATFRSGRVGRIAAV